MEKYLTPVPIGEGDLSDGWLRFKLEFQQSLTAIGKEDATEQFLQLKQVGRVIDPFVMEIRKEVKDCQFGALKADLMLHVLIRGIDDERMRCRLFEVENLDLAKAIRMCQTMEATAADLQHLVSKKTEMVEGETAGVALVSKKEIQGTEDSEEVAEMEKQSWKVPGRKQDRQGADRRPGTKPAWETVVKSSWMFQMWL
ncbi:hypothetical protein EMCRGX_G030181 [Ephydatia muelleri]